jgi:hypothetical protein
MAKCHESWQIFPHRPIEKLESNLWRVEGDLPNGNGTRVMTIARMRDGGLCVHNAIALEPELMAEIEAFGRPRIMAVPSGFHRLDAKVWKQRYSDSKVVCPKGSRKKVEQVVAVDATYDEALGDDDVKLAHLAGTRDVEGHMTVRSGDALTYVFNDAINNLPRMGGLFGFLFAPTGVAAVPRFARWMMVKDKAAMVAELERMAGAPGLRRIIVSHGKTIDDGPADTLRAVAGRLRG